MILCYFVLLITILNIGRYLPGMLIFVYSLTQQILLVIYSVLGNIQGTLLTL